MRNSLNIIDNPDCLFGLFFVFFFRENDYLSIKGHMENMCVQIFEHTLEKLGSEIKSELSAHFVCPDVLGIGPSEERKALVLTS